MDTLARLNELLTEHGMTLHALSMETGLPYSTLKTSRNKGTQLSVDTIDTICRYFGMPLEEFFKTHT